MRKKHLVQPLFLLIFDDISKIGFCIGNVGVEIFEDTLCSMTKIFSIDLARLTKLALSVFPIDFRYDALIHFDTVICVLVIDVLGIGFEKVMDEIRSLHYEIDPITVPIDRHAIEVGAILETIGKVFKECLPSFPILEHDEVHLAAGGHVEHCAGVIFEISACRIIA